MATQNTGTYANGKVTYSTSTTSGYQQAYGTITIPVVDKKPEVKVLTEDDIEVVAEMLHNLLQDALVTCEEDCCSETNSKIDFTAISLNIIKVITADYSIGNEEKDQLLKQIADAKREISDLKKQAIMHNHKEVEGMHEKRLNSFKSRTYYNKKDYK